MKSSVSGVWTFLRVAVTGACIGGGIGAITAWLMTVWLPREYQMSMAETGATLGTVLGLVLGCLAYYAVFRGRIDFLTFGTIVTVTTILSASSAFVLHILTDTGGWFGLPIGVITFFGTCLKLRASASRLEANGRS